MTKEEAETEIGALSDELLRNQYEYYVLGNSSATDLEYDHKFDRLIELEAEFPDLKRPDSPTARVGSDLTSDLPEADHTIPVLSLDKVYTEAELVSWMRKTEVNTETELSFIVEEKIDGVSIVLYYTDGLLSRAVTRGNGYTGNDVTANAKTIGSIPLRLPEPATLAVRGEIYLPTSKFKEINAGLDEQYANPRNLTAGTIRRIKSADVAAIPLEMYAYEGFFRSQPATTVPATHVEILARLAAYGFRLNPRIAVFGVGPADEEVERLFPKWRYGTLEDVPDYIGQMVAERNGLDYEIDGLVAKVNEIEARERLGYTGHHPRWEMAFKFEAPQGVTRIRGIDIQVGRTGRITPVARVEPVRIGGSVVSNVTLHNSDYIEMLELAVGDTVAVSKRGDVIPAVERVIEKNEAGNMTWAIPDSCPSCGTRLTVVGAHHFCPNTAGCPDQLKGRIFFFIGKGQMDIENLGPETAMLLIERGDLSDVPDIYTFDYERLRGTPGFGDRKIELIVRGVEKSKERPFRVVLPSLGIPELGQKVTELLIGAGYDSIDKLLAAADVNAVEDLSAILGIGEKTAATVLEHLRDPAVRRRIEALRAAGLRFHDEPVVSDESLPRILEGQVWCVTGSFERFNPRSLAMDEVKTRGGRVVTSVTGKTTHLLAGEGAGSKLRQALSLGVTVVSESEFIELLGL